MSTPSVTILKNLVLNWKSNQMEEETIATFYRHYDGYPSCHAIDIANSLVVASRTKPEQHIDFSGASVERNILNNRNWCQHFLKAMCMADADIEFIGEGALFLWLFGSRPAGGVKARGRCGNGDSGAAFPPFQQPAGRARNPPAIESAEKPSTWRKRGTDLPGFPTFRQAPGQSRNPPPIGMLKTPSSRETIGRRRGKAGHAAAAR